MPSEFDPLPARPVLSSEASDLDQVQALFSGAARGYLRSPWPWLCWAVVLPAGALMSADVASAGGPLAVLMLWTVVIFVAGAVEAVTMWRSVGAVSSDIPRWVFRAQGNLSLIAVVLTAALAWQGAYAFLPAVWLLLVGHSFYTVGELAAPPLARGGLLYQLGGVVSLLPRIDSLIVFAVTAAAANLVIAAALWRRARSEPSRR